jgi:hypothetical protein
MDGKANQTQVMKNKIYRGQLLRTLTLFYPNPVDISSLKTALMTRGIVVTAEISNILHYLQDKQYIRVTEGRIVDLSDSDLIELTAKGVDLMECTITDPGVDV